MSTEQQRKMLECAAKACGYGELIFCNGADDDGYDNGVWKYTWRRDESGKLLLWNPLSNPSDTAEMCAKLGIGTRWYLLNDCVVCGPRYNNVTAYFKDHDNSRLKAWMYAAMMCAAKIGGYEDAHP